MELHSSNQKTDTEKTFIVESSPSFSHYSFGFVHGFVLCLIVKDLHKQFGKDSGRDDDDSSFFQSVIASSSQPACVSSGESCGQVKQEALDRNSREHDQDITVDSSSTDIVYTECQKLGSNASDGENPGNLSPVSSFYLPLPDLSDTEDYQSSDVEKSRSRKRRRNTMSKLTEPKQRKPGKPSMKGKKAASKIRTKSSLKAKLTEKLKAKVSSKLRTTSARRLKNDSRNIVEDEINTLQAVHDTATTDDSASVGDTVPLASQSFPCDQCGKTFASAKACKTHAAKSHSKSAASVRKKKRSLAASSEQFPCDICDKTFPSARSYHRHAVRVHESKTGDCAAKESLQSTCAACGKVYRGLCADYNLQQHVLALHGELQPVNCDVCGATLNNAHHLRLHRRSSHRNDVCHICGARFVTQVGLQTHLLAHKGDKSFVCELCGAAFVRESSLRQHAKNHTPSRDFRCGRCALSFKTFSSLSIHLMCVHQCGSYFGGKVKKLAQLGYVIDSDVIERIENCQCATCGQTLMDSACPTHAADCLLSFSCTQCQWTTKDVQKFLKHLVRRNKSTANSDSESRTCGGLMVKKRPLEKNFVCPSCGKVFYTQAHLQVHRYQHTEKRFSCSYCGKTFTYKCNMQKHETTHTDARPFECGACDKKFKMKSELQLHQRFHDGEFKCEVCGKVLTRRQYVVNHYKLVHPGMEMPQ